MLEFMRREFDSDKDVTRQFHLSDFRETIGFVIGKPELRGLAFGSFAFVGLQTTFIAYFVIYLTEIGFSLNCGWNDIFDCDGCCHTGPDFLGMAK
jgi:hypothetical protein